MKKIHYIYILLFLSVFKVEAQSLNWSEVLYGNLKGLQANNIKSLQLKKGSKVIRSIEVDSQKRQIIAKDSLNINYFDFDTNDQLVSLRSIKNNRQEKLELNYKESQINALSRFIDHEDFSYYNKFSKFIFQGKSYETKETYRFDKIKNDSTEVFRTQYIFNESNPDLSYEEIYRNGKIWEKKYFNDTEVKKEKFDGYYTVDSTLQKDYKRTKFHFENYPDHQIIKIEKDSVLTINKKSGKKISEKLEYASLPFKEIFYDENENVKEKIVYFNYRNSFNEIILWEETKYDGNGKLVSRKFPNKKIYKLKNGILVFRKKTTRHIISCGSGYPFRNKSVLTYYPQFYSSSILFTTKLANNFSDNFDIYAIDEEEEIIYSYLDFKDDAMVTKNYSASKDVKDELRSTSRNIRRKDRYVLKYFDGIKVEAETISGKKYTIDLVQNPELLSFAIYTFLIKD
ncbi:hypothetical protein [Chryseobacterium ginsengisoli]|uniref:hypothetical protein n=1 Tax=Chryseobacterium ginsengisoli TaxID=363853 RepID=UPI0031EDC3E7